MTDQKKKIWEYGTTVYAAIILIAVIIAVFIYSLIMGQGTDVDDYVPDSDVPALSPDASVGPDYSPDLPAPAGPPPDGSPNGN
jgi:hypothetical protein